MTSIRGVRAGFGTSTSESCVAELDFDIALVVVSDKF